MPTGLRRIQRAGHLHFITFSTFRHRPILGTPQARDKFLEILEQTRAKHDFNVYAYVVMSTHVHLVLSEPKLEPLSTSVQVLKQRFSRTRPEEEVWEKRYYDFNLREPDKRVEKIRYMHRNPVEAGIVASPEDWPWSSFPHLLARQNGPVTLTHPTW